jgi:hypothetical protein
MVIGTDAIANNAMVQITNGIMDVAANYLSIDPNSRILYAPVGVQNLSWATADQIDLFNSSSDAVKPLNFNGSSNSGTISFDTTNNYFQFSDSIWDGSYMSIDPNTRILYASDGSTAMLDWSTDGTVDLGDNELTTTGAGTFNDLTLSALTTAGVLINDASGVITSQAPVADGTYTMGFGSSTNGTITITNGIITAVQEATN